MTDSTWQILEEQFTPEKQAHHETIFTIGNGYLGTRGAFEEFTPGENRATFVHGIFDDAPIIFTELANFPDWLEFEIWANGQHFDLHQGEVLDYRRWLDLRTGLLTRQVHWRSPQGLVMRLTFERFASLADPHLMMVRLQVTPENGEAEIELHAGLNGEADNEGLKHWRWQAQGQEQNTAWLELRTRTSNLGVALGMHLHLHSFGPLATQMWDVRNHPTLIGRAALKPHQTLTAEKVVAIATQRETPTPRALVLSKLNALAHPAWPVLWEKHCAAWQKTWEQCDVEIEGDDQAQLAIRFNLFQLLIAAPANDERVSIGAKTLSGYGYRGHVFWDTEIFMLPFFICTRPELARNLLSYRYHCLPGARRKASANGWRGAQYPWESAATGDEVTPTWVPHFNDAKQLVRIWTGDIEIHISADVTYAIWQYVRTSGDERFLLERGAEIILETARFWAERAEWNEAKQRYEYTDVIGPDEYHDHVDNNAYTNYLARWNLNLGMQLANWLEKEHPQDGRTLFERLALTEAERQHWQQVATALYCPFDPHSKQIEQFDGYFARRDVDLAALEPRTRSVQALLGIEGANQTQVLKQPDVLMLIYLLPELFDEETRRANYAYYTPRTDHTYGSSLGPSIQAILACRMGSMEEAWEHFQRAANADLHDVRGNAGDGIHGASAGGLWQAIVFGFGGLRLTENGWCAAPRLPAHWKRLRFTVQWHGQSQTFDLTPGGAA
jgi:kojibiose phosphorylase